MASKGKLKRKTHPIPAFVLAALESEMLMGAFSERPAYQRNDYVGWINTAKRDETKQKRLMQMLAELKQGGVYMNMDHPPSRKQ